MSRCLLLVDLQNEFLSPSGKFPVHSSCLPFLENLESVIHYFRRAGDPIIWIRSEYTTTPLHSPRDRIDPAAFLAGTHTGRKPCCERDSHGAEFPDRIAVLIDNNVDKVITKTWFSAFKETTLATALAEIAVTDLYLGGLLTNVCVRATVTDAVSFPFREHVLEDCLGWRVRTSHEHALAKMRTLGAHVLSGPRLINPPIENDIPSANGENVQASLSHDCQNQLPTLYYVNGSIPSWRVMMALYEKVHRNITIFICPPVR
jgi:nicotinamidase-related amidase